MAVDDLVTVDLHCCLGMLGCDRTMWVRSYTSLPDNTNDNREGALGDQKSFSKATKCGMKSICLNLLIETSLSYNKRRMNAASATVLI